MTTEIRYDDRGYWMIVTRTGEYAEETRVYGTAAGHLEALDRGLDTTEDGEQALALEILDAGGDLETATLHDSGGEEIGLLWPHESKCEALRSALCWED